MTMTNNMEQLLNDLLEAHEEFLFKGAGPRDEVAFKEKQYYVAKEKIINMCKKLQSSVEGTLEVITEPKSKPKQYMYKRIVALSDTGMIPDELNSLGKEGWELAGITEGDTFYFKKEIM